MGLDAAKAFLNGKAETKDARGWGFEGFGIGGLLAYGTEKVVNGTQSVDGVLEGVYEIGTPLLMFGSMVNGYLQQRAAREMQQRVNEAESREELEKIGEEYDITGLDRYFP